MNKVDVVLAAFNGEEFINSQVQSILEQTYSNFTIIAHDDGSTDETIKILEAAAHHDRRVKILHAPPTGGASANFNFLLSKATENYVFCSDQDDIWDRTKIEEMMKLMEFYERVYGEDVPLMIHSDLKLIDRVGQKISESFWHYQHLDPKWGDSFPRLLTQNVVTGCAMLVNRALINKALPVPQGVMMHDWWIALVACAYGRITWMDRATVNYRQHGKNELGAKQFNFVYVVNKFINLLDRNGARINLQKTSQQSAIFSKIYSDSEFAQLACIYSQLPHMSFWTRRISIIKNKFYKVGLVRNLAWMLFI